MRQIEESDCFGNSDPSMYHYGIDENSSNKDPIFFDELLIL